MKSDFLIAITQLSAEKNLPKEVVLGAVEAALVSAYRKDSFAPNQNIQVKISPTTGTVKVWAEKTVVEKVTETSTDISLTEARRTKPDVQLGEAIMVEDTPHNAGRIAAQTAKQVILQRLHEAEHSAIFEEYAGKEGDIVTGVVQRTEPKQVLIDLGRVEAVMPSSEQSPNERYRVGQRLKVCLLEVARGTRGPRIVVSRSHPDLIRRLFESEVPEVFSGVVEIKSIAREAGYRSKVAVAAKQEKVDPVGCCVGLRGIRIQNIVSELGGEKIDVVAWSSDPATFITNALSPAQVLTTKLDEKEGVATVVVPDRQLSLAIGREGQNVRLAAKLAGWKIDIKSASDAEIEAAKAQAEAAAAAAVAEPVAEVAVAEAPAAEPVLEPATVTLEVTPVVEEVKETVEVTEEEEPVPVEIPVAIGAPVAAGKSRLRFAEDILGHRPAKVEAKGKKKKKGKEVAEDGIRLKKRRREIITGDVEEFLDE